MSNTLLDIWSLLLNKKEKHRAHIDSGIPKKFYFTTQHSIFLDRVFEEMCGKAPIKTTKKKKLDDDIEIVEVKEEDIF